MDLKIEAFKQIFFDAERISEGNRRLTEYIDYCNCRSFDWYYYRYFDCDCACCAKIQDTAKNFEWFLFFLCWLVPWNTDGSAAACLLLCITSDYWGKLTGVQVSVLVFGLNSGAYISEMMRAGILSVDGGQMEAGRAMGLSFATTMRKIVIPQAVKNILPTLGNEFIALIKETSVVSFVGAADLYVAFNYIGSNSYEFMVPYLVMAVIYIALVLLISLGIKCMERSLRKSDRRN